MHELFGAQVDQVALAATLQHYTRTVLVHHKVVSTLNQDALRTLRDADARPYHQATAFLNLLDGGAASPDAVMAIEEALKDAKAEHLLKGSCCKLAYRLVQSFC